MMSNPSPSNEELMQKAAEEVDQSLLDWFLSLSPVERLRHCTETTRSLANLDPSKDKLAVPILLSLQKRKG